MSAFQITALPYEPFAPLFDLGDAQLNHVGALRVRAKSNPGYPCRVSLRDAEIGEELLLLPYEHQPGDSPYRASGPIYVRRGAMRCVPEPGQLPECVIRRLISVRAYDARHLMIDAAAAQGTEVAAVIQQQFANATVAYIHLHNAKPGCFACRVDRTA